jgi:hypothetical protein
MAEPSPVEVTNTEPMPVTVAREPDTDAQAMARVVASKAAADEGALVSEGQRGINRLWERTQAIVAVQVVAVTLGVVAVLIVVPVLRGDKETAASTAALVLLSSLATNIITSYFTRTNHTKVGGVGGGTRGE